MYLFQSHVQEVCSEKEQQTLRLQLTRKDAELSKAQETVRRQQQQIEEMRQRVCLYSDYVYY